jgi:hypothetical protein
VAIVVGIFTIPGLLIGLYQAAQKYNWLGFGAHATITSPAQNSIIGTTVVVRGFVKNAEDSDIWIVTRRAVGGEVYPKAKLNLLASGEFEHEIPNGGKDGPIGICVIMADESTSRQFEDWRQAATQTGQFTGVRMPQRGVLTCQTYELRNYAIP